MRGRDSRVLCDVSCTRQSGFCLMCSPSLRVFMVRHQRQHFRRPSRTCWARGEAQCRTGRQTVLGSQWEFRSCGDGSKAQQTPRWGLDVGQDELT